MLPSSEEFKIIPYAPQLFGLGRLCCKTSEYSEKRESVRMVRVDLANMDFGTLT